MMGYQAEKKVCSIFSHLDTIHECDRQMAKGRQLIPWLCIVLHSEIVLTPVERR